MAPQTRAAFQARRRRYANVTWEAAKPPVMPPLVTQTNLNDHAYAHGYYAGVYPGQYTGGPEYYNGEWVHNTTQNSHFSHGHPPHHLQPS